MEDSLSVKSNDSTATSDEFDFVCDKPGTSKTPTLDIKDGNLCDLQKALDEVLNEPNFRMEEPILTPIISKNDNATKKVDKNEKSSSGSPTNEKHDEMKPEISEESEDEGKKSFSYSY